MVAIIEKSNSTLRQLPFRPFEISLWLQACSPHNSYQFLFFRSLVARPFASVPPTAIPEWFSCPINLFTSKYPATELIYRHLRPPFIHRVVYCLLHTAAASAPRYALRSTSSSSITAAAAVTNSLMDGELNSSPATAAAVCGILIVAVLVRTRTDSGGAIGDRHWRHRTPDVAIILTRRAAGNPGKRRRKRPKEMQRSALADTCVSPDPLAVPSVRDARRATARWAAGLRVWSTYPVVLPQ